MSDISKYIKHIIIEKDMKQAEIADKMQTTRSNLASCISRGSKMTITTLESIADAMDCDVEIRFIDRKDGKRY